MLDTWNSALEDNITETLRSFNLEENGEMEEKNMDIRAGQANALLSCKLI